MKRIALVWLLAGACQEAHTIGWQDVASTTCGPALEGGAFRPCTATYLSGTGDEGTTAVDIAGDGTLLVATRLAGRSLGPSGLAVRLAPGDATLVRLSPSGREVLSTTAVGDEISDLEVEPTSGRVALVGRPFGVLTLTPDGRRALWQASTAGTRVSIAGDGHVAVLGGNTVELFDGNGTRVRSWPTRIDSGGDVAFVGETVVVTGSLTVGTFVQPVLDGYAANGAPRFAHYGWSAALLMERDLQAASMGVAVARGRDGKLYYLGRSRGGNTVHGRLPFDLDSRVPMPALEPFSQPYNTAVEVMFVARFAETGALEAGRFLLPREPASANGKGRPVFPTAVAADELGRVLVGGRLACCIPSSEQPTWKGEPPAIGAADAFAVLLSPSLDARILWTTFGAGAEVSGVAIARGVAALAAIRRSADGGALMVESPLIATPPGGATDVYLATFAWP